jgi:quercetin dioxygenase-like cupin family protein
MALGMATTRCCPFRAFGEGSVVLDGKPPQTFKAGQAFVEMPNAVHNFRNASTTEGAKALGFQYAGKGQPLQINAP